MSRFHLLRTAGWTMNKSDPHLTGNIGSTHLQRLWNCNSFMIQPWTDANLKKVLKSPIFDLCFFSCLQVPRIFRYESWWFGFPFNLCRGVIARRFKRLDHLMQAKRPSDRWTHTFSERAADFSVDFFWCVCLLWAQTKDFASLPWMVTRILSLKKWYQ